ncbi:MAG: ComEC family competence protein [Synergistaceae bacterium]|nr:ComEC family competence protein [Synergistaceae bacterium]
MSPLASAPFLVILSGWCAGIALSTKLSPPAASLAASLFGAGFLLISTKRWPPGWKRVLPVLLLTVSLPVFFMNLRLHPKTVREESWMGQAWIRTERAWGSKRAVTLASPKGRLLCLLEPEARPLEGERVQVSGTVVPLESLFSVTSEGEFDPARYWRAKGVEFGFRCSSVAAVDPPGNRKTGWRTRLRKKLLLSLSPLVRGHLLAAWTGEKDPEVASMHRRWGTAHLLAVSGFHVGVLGAILLWCLRRFRFKLLVCSSLLWGYVFLTGCASSACRAMGMIQLGFLGPVLAGRPSSPLNSVSVAGGILLLINPWLFWDIGWRLSVISALILCSVVRGGVTPMRGLAASLAIWMGTSGEASAAFETVPLAGLVLNLFALPAFSFLLPVASVAAIPVLAGFPGGWVPLWGMEGLFEAWARFADCTCMIVHWQIASSPWLWNFSAAIVGGAVAYGLETGVSNGLILSLCAFFCGGVFR